MNPVPQFGFPYGFDAAGRTAGADEAEHIRDLLEQLLLTRAGERVNRPDFGAGLMHAVFGGSGPEAATALELASRAALHRYLGDVIEVQGLGVRAVDSALIIDIHYALRRTSEKRSASIVLGEPA